MILTVSGLEKSFGGRTLFKGADLHVTARDRVALVGPNGSGKSTLFSMIVGQQEPDAGDLKIASGVVIGLLEQETDDLRGSTLIEEVLSVSSDVTEAAHRLQILETEMAEVAGGARDRLIQEYGRLQDRFSTLGGYSLEATAKKILAGLGFTEDDHSRATEEFSGGWLMRIALAKLLLANPDLLMLDEPTNHLDLESVQWLEDYLSTYEGAILLISHDRDLIDGIATRVVEVSGSKLVSYTGGFEDFVNQRELLAAQAEAEAKNRGRKVAATERFIERFRYKASKARQVQSRIKSLERMQEIEAPAAVRARMKLSFPPAPRSGRVMLELESLGFAYGDGPPVYERLDLAVERGEKVALVGPNGAGKTTLLKLIAGALDPTGGVRRIGHNVSIGYFAQHQIEALEPGNTVLAELETAVPPQAKVRARDLLGRFLFRGDDVKKPVAVLSGGERTRLALAKLLVAPVNLLCLDEPTNHLDMQSRDVLEDALVEFGGAIVLITHDRHLIRSVSNRIVEVAGGRAQDHPDLDRYLATREEKPTQTTAEPKPVSSAKQRRREGAAARARTSDARKRARRAETQLRAASEELATLAATLGDPEVYRTDVDVRQLVKDHDRVKRRVQSLEEEWLEASMALEDQAGGTEEESTGG